MVKKVLCLWALLAASVALFSLPAVAQDLSRTPVPKISDLILERPTEGKLIAPMLVPKPDTPPAYCSPCLFYGGDFAPQNVNADGLANEDSQPDVGLTSTIYVPFHVPNYTYWEVDGLFQNILTTAGQIDPKEANWSISSGVGAGNPGTTLYSGTSGAHFTPTGRVFLGAYTEYTLEVKGLTGIHLSPGLYWLSVVPLCTNPNNDTCNSAQYYASDSLDGPNAYGPREPLNLSFWNSSYFGVYYVQANSGGKGFSSFSAGVIGVSHP